MKTDNLTWDMIDKINKFIEAGHLPYLNEDKTPDIFRLDSGFHNGPECQKCGYSVCWHCVSDFEPCPVK